MADVFISYKREERAQVERIATALRGLGFSVWFDASLSAGESFTDEIDREVRGAKVVLVCWSAAAMASRWVKAEAQIGFGNNNIISVHVAGSDGVEPPVPFNSIQTEDLRAWVQRPSNRDTNWRSVLRALGALTARADVADWGALPLEADMNAIQAWFERHGETSPLVLDAEAALDEAKARGEARAVAEAAARQRLAHAAAEEKAAREREEAERRARAAEEKAARDQALAEKRARDAEARAKRAEAAAKLTRRVLVWGGVPLALAGVAGGGIRLWDGLEGSDPFLRGALPEARLTAAGRAAGLSIRPGPRLRGHRYVVTSTAFSPDGERLITSSVDGTLRIWDARSGAALRVLEREDQYTPDSVAFSPDGQRILHTLDSFTREDVACVRRVSDGHILFVLGHGRTGVHSAAFSPSGASIVTTGGGDFAHIWEATFGRRLRTLSGHGDIVGCAAFSPDGQRVVTASHDRTARIWLAATGESVLVLRGHEGDLTSAGFSPDGARVLTCSDDRTARVWNSINGELVRTLDHRNGLRAAAFDNEGKLIITANQAGVARIWNADDGAELASLHGHEEFLTSATFSPDGRAIVTASGDATARLWFRTV